MSIKNIPKLKMGQNDTAILKFMPFCQRIEAFKKHLKHFSAIHTL